MEKSFRIVMDIGEISEKYGDNPFALAKALVEYIEEIEKAAQEPLEREIQELRLEIREKDKRIENIKEIIRKYERGY